MPLDSANRFWYLNRDRDALLEMVRAALVALNSPEEMRDDPCDDVLKDRIDAAARALLGGGAEIAVYREMLDAERQKLYKERAEWCARVETAEAATKRLRKRVFGLIEKLNEWADIVK